MSIYKVYGLSEIMIQHCDIDKDTLFQMEPIEYRTFIDEKFNCSVTGNTYQNGKNN
tara:strand:- start:1 stop:168 length:168 start_codon:yes stop_codon:yes gene_type:complete